jgi:hypothetical protein
MKYLSLSLVLLSLATSSAHATELVLYGSKETEDIARAKVALFGGRTLANLQAQTLTALVSGDLPVVVGGATVSYCEGDPGSNAAIKALVEATESKVLFMEFESAKMDLDMARDLERCLTEPLDAAVASRAHYLRAMVAVGSGDPGAAWPEFLQAVNLKPDITWDENFPPDGRTAFKGAVAAIKVGETQDFHLVPPPEIGLWVDGIVQGNAEKVALKPGAHVLQLGTEGSPLTTYVVDLPEETRAAMLFPGKLEDDRADWAGDGATRGRLEAVLAANSQGAIAYVSLPGQVLWQFDPGPWKWTDLSGVSDEEIAALDASAAAANGTPAGDAAAEAAVTPGTDGAAGNSLVTTGLLYGGAGVAVLGGALAGLGYKAMNAAHKTSEETQLAKEERIKELQTEFDAGKQRHVLGLALLGLGAAGASSSFFLDSPAGFTLEPMFRPNGTGGVTLHTRW